MRTKAKAQKTKKDKQENLFKRWYKLCEPNKKVWFFQMFFYVLYAGIYASMTIFAAKTINCLYNSDWKGAFFWLAIEFLDIMLRSLAYHCQYIFYGKHYGIIRKNITTKIYDKLMKCEERGIKKLSSEKIINIAQENMSYAGEFPEYIASICSYLVQVVIALVTIFTANIYAGLIVACLGVVNFFVYNALNKKMGRIMNNRYEKKDNSFKEYTKILSGKAVIQEIETDGNYKKNLLSHIDEFNKEYSKYYITNSFRDNVYYIIWNVVVYAITAFLIYFVSKGRLEISVYLIIVPYLTTCTDKLNTLYTKFGGVENMRVDVDRINMILNLTDRQLVQYGNINKVSEGYNLGLIDVSYKSSTPNKVNLRNIDISFKMHGVNIIKGDRGCGKRPIFNMLRRRIKPDSGEILLDNLNLYDYSEKTFKNNIDYCSSHPSFISGTVKENLLLVKNDFKFITELVKELELEDKINALPQGYDTQISDITDGETRFWIGLIRAALSNCKILMIYEYPEEVTPSFHTTLQKIIAKSEPQKRTLILFTHKDDYDSLADMIFKIQNGKIKIGKPFNQRNKTHKKIHQI